MRTAANSRLPSMPSRSMCLRTIAASIVAIVTSHGRVISATPVGRMNMTCHVASPVRVRRRRDAPDASEGSPRGRRKSGLIAARYLLAAVTMTVGAVALNVPASAQTADDLAKQYNIDAMEQALQTKERFDLYGLRFDSDQSTIQADAQPLLDDIATALKNFPEWRLRIVGHTDATGDPRAQRGPVARARQRHQGGAGRAWR